MGKARGEKLARRDGYLLVGPRHGPLALKRLAECLKPLIAHPDTSGYAPPATPSGLRIDRVFLPADERTRI